MLTLSSSLLLGDDWSPVRSRGSLKKGKLHDQASLHVASCKAPNIRQKNQVFSELQASITLRKIAHNKSIASFLKPIVYEAAVSSA